MWVGDKGVVGVGWGVEGMKMGDTKT